MANIQPFKGRTAQQGVSLILAIFIIVGLSLLGAAMMNLSKTGADTVAREVISTRALLAAESGAQRLLNEIFPPGSSTANTAPCFAPPLYTWEGLTGCENVKVDLDCQSISVDGVNYFTVTSTGHCGPVDDQAVRVVEIKAKG
jgi:MSHA biogenesis protein MshP